MQPSIAPMNIETNAANKGKGGEEQQQEEESACLMNPILIDFGIAKDVNSSGATVTMTKTSIAGGVEGTEHYIDPALLNGKLKRATMASDVWSFGGLFL